MSPRLSADLGDLGDVHGVRNDWRKPKPGEFLYDARDFFRKAKASQKAASKGRYARASILLSVAAVEAISNDALLTIYELLVDSWPSECIGSAPWRFFTRVSHRPIKRLLVRQRSLAKKIQYLFHHLRRLSLSPELDDLEERLKDAIAARNRILHMEYLFKPRRAAVSLNPRQIVPLSEKALGAAEDYISELGYTFEQVNLGVVTASDMYSRPLWWRDEDWE
jgi:hypothetical protein